MKHIELIKHFESLHDGDLSAIGLQPKMDPIGIWTEGYGRAMTDPKTKGHLRGAHNKQRAYELATISNEADALKALKHDSVMLGELPAKKQLGDDYWNKLLEHQKGGLTSFVYNCGTHNPSTKKPYLVFEKVKQWVDKKITDQQLFDYWSTSVIKGGGKVLPGLVRRRKAEAHLVLFNKLKFDL